MDEFNRQAILGYPWFRWLIEDCEMQESLKMQFKTFCSNRTGKDLQIEIAHLEPWQAINLGQEKTEEFVKFTAEAFYRNY